ncbi:hypothetical protein Daesc_009558 [Daldinia eschscholtzii]|uniref:Uncharacterized protein n=1 Tax=Daldinia eschscholtzii TaxID=292717 RepID=A0AAX6MAR8_9PEZI
MSRTASISLAVPRAFTRQCLVRGSLSRRAFEQTDREVNRILEKMLSVEHKGTVSPLEDVPQLTTEILTMDSHPELSQQADICLEQQDSKDLRHDRGLKDQQHEDAGRIIKTMDNSSKKKNHQRTTRGISTEEAERKSRKSTTSTRGTSTEEAGRIIKKKNHHQQQHEDTSAEEAGRTTKDPKGNTNQPSNTGPQDPTAKSFFLFH